VIKINRGLNFKMKKAIVILTIFFFIMQGISIGTTHDAEHFEETIRIENPNIIQNQQTTNIQFKETEIYNNIPGEPRLPKYVKTYTYPFKTQIKNVEVEFLNPVTYEIVNPIQISPYPINTKTTNKQQINSNDYNEKYEASYHYNAGSGIQNKEHLLFLNIQINPITYLPDEKTITIYQDVNINIETIEPKNPVIFPDEYDLLIIAPNKFHSDLEPLVTHKNNIGMRTILTATEGIIGNYQGRDDAEKLKYYIKESIEETGIKYVLLVGGRYGGILEEKWHVPVRYAHLDDNSNFEGSYLSDLYFADIYDEFGEFADWDPNGNGVFAEWIGFNKEILELLPDISVGRLACKNNKEVQIMVDKIITYETTPDKPWFKTIVLVGGDSAPGDTYDEGEEENKKALEYLQSSGFTGVHRWTSDQTLTGPQDVIDAINPGSGFLFFDGHGNPATWSNHPHNDSDTWITGLDLTHMPKLSNTDKLPVCVIGGCHNGQFNVSLFNIPKHILEFGLNAYILGPPFLFYRNEWVPECWAWKLASEPRGGSIATLAYSGLDWFAVGDYDGDGIPDCTQAYSGFANTHFFKNYGENDLTILGEAHTQTLIDYINTHPPMDYVLDAKTVEEFVLLGDPSLQLG
jgi:hypothetical protein